jgi:hypothetical protein
LAFSAGRLLWATERWVLIFQGNFLRIGGYLIYCAPEITEKTTVATYTFSQNPRAYIYCALEIMEKATVGNPICTDRYSVVQLVLKWKHACNSNFAGDRECVPLK